MHPTALARSSVGRSPWQDAMARTVGRRAGGAFIITTARSSKVRRSESRSHHPGCYQSRHFTFPDLSQLSPFKSATTTTRADDEEGGGGRGDDGCERYHETVVMPFPRTLLFHIVSDVDDYENFVPYCVQSRVDRSSEKQIDANTKQFQAELAIGYGQLREAYTSQVTIVEGKSVQAIAVPTPLFERLETTWTFRDDDDDNALKGGPSSSTTTVDFHIKYSFSNPFYAAFAKTAMDKMTSKMIDAFTTRAQEQQLKHQ